MNRTVVAQFYLATNFVCPGDDAPSVGQRRAGAAVVRQSSRLDKQPRTRHRYAQSAMPRFCLGIGRLILELLQSEASELLEITAEPTTTAATTTTVNE